jgi:hypothetical protein
MFLILGPSIKLLVAHTLLSLLDETILVVVVVYPLTYLLFSG